MYGICRTYADRQRRVPCADFDMEKKLKESVAWLKEGHSVAIRNRAQSLCQAFSISRFDETGEWEIADAWPLTYPTSLPSMGPQPIQTIYIVQGEHKTRSVSIYL